MRGEDAMQICVARRKKYNNIGDTKELEISSPFTEKILGK